MDEARKSSGFFRWRDDIFHKNAVQPLQETPMKTTVSALLILALFATSPILSQDQPGNGKKFGVAINPVFALFSIASLEFNVWNIDRRAEINMPVIFSNNAKFGKDVKVSFEEVGIHYRYSSINGRRASLPRLVGNTTT